MKRPLHMRAAACMLAAVCLLCTASCSGGSSSRTSGTTATQAFSVQDTEPSTATEIDLLSSDFAQPLVDAAEWEPFSLTEAAEPVSEIQPADALQTAAPVQPSISQAADVQTTTPVPSTTLPTTTAPTTTEPVVTAHIHSYHTTVVPPTCSERGYIRKSCECGDEQIEYNADALGHDFSEFVVTKEATPTQDGEKTRTCSRCGLQETEKITKVRPYTSMEAAQELLQLVNASRAQAGVDPLTFNYTYYTCAQTRAQEIASTYAHTRPNGQAWYTVIAEKGLEQKGSCAENIYNPYGDSVPASDAHTAFMNSSGHRTNILNPAYKSASICVIYTQERTYFVQMFFGWT